MSATIAAQIDGAGMWSGYSPWWVELRVRAHGALEVTYWDGDLHEHEIDPETGEGVLTRVVTSAELRAAREAAEAEGVMCCDRGYWCASDADQVLQRAVYGLTVWG